MEDRIGKLAGEVWNFLQEKEEASVSQIAKSVEGSRSKVNMAVGWLAREDKLEFIEVNRGNRVRLK